MVKPAGLSLLLLAASSLACDDDRLAPLADDGEASGPDRHGPELPDDDPGPDHDSDRSPEQCHVDPDCDVPGMPDDPGAPENPDHLARRGAHLVVLPDTQIYSRDYPGIFHGQTSWIAENVEAFNIRHVFHLGDIVDADTVGEWQRARDAMSTLDGVVPYAIVPGNHDYQHWGKTMNRVTALTSWFPYEEHSAMPTFGGAYQVGRIENTYHLFSAAGREWIALALEWGPRDEVVAWADQVMLEHDDRLGILVTHAYLNNNDRRYDHTDTVHAQDFNPHNYDLAGSINDGEQLWQKLVRRHRFVMTLSGHVLGDGAGYLASRTDLGNTCHQMLSNYQMREMGGEGYLRLLELHPDGNTVAVRTYSPLLDSYLARADQSFSFDLDVDL